MAWSVIPNLGAVGVSKDPQSQELDAGTLTDAVNVSMQGGAIERIRGRTGVGPTGTVAPYFLLPYANPAGRYFLQAGLATIYSNDLNATLTNITRASGPYTGTVSDRWTGGELHGVAVLNNGVDVPQYWGGTGLAADLPNWPTGWKSAVVRPFRNFLIALNQTKSATAYPYLVNWSHEADPGSVPDSWDTADATKDAGEFPLSETPGAIVDGLAFGERFFVYKEDAIYQVDYIGPPSIFKFSKISDTYGVFARNCVANTPNGQVVLSGGDVILNAGNGQFPSLINNRMRRWLFSNLDAQSRYLSFVVANPKRNEVMICFPELGASSCTLALVWNWIENTLSTQQLDGVQHGAAGIVPAGTGSTWASATGTWEQQTNAWNQIDYGATDPRLLFSGLQLSASDQGMTFNGTNIDARIERTGLAFGDPDSVKCLKGLRPRIDARNGTVLSVRIGGQMDPQGAVTWGPAIQFTVGTDTTVYGFATGRFLAYRIESTGVLPWRLRSISFDLAPMGQY